VPGVGPAGRLLDEHATDPLRTAAAMTAGATVVLSRAFIQVNRLDFAGVFAGAGPNDGPRSRRRITRLCLQIAEHAFDGRVQTLAGEIGSRIDGSLDITNTRPSNGLAAAAVRVGRCAAAGWRPQFTALAQPPAWLGGPRLRAI
jgi:hypothetical protein